MARRPPAGRSTDRWSVRTGKLPVEIHPFAVPANPFGLRLHLSSTDDAEVDRVFVGDVEIPQANLTRENGAYTFPAPTRGRGLVDVRIVPEAGDAVTLPGALYYYDHVAPLDTSVFERILFPVLFQSAGAHGSAWVSEAAIANPQPWAVETVNHVFPFVCITYPCGERLAPDSFISFNGFGYPHGIALIAPRGEADGLAFSLRVRDTARSGEGYGTQVPVVREAQMVEVVMPLDAIGWAFASITNNETQQVTIVAPQ